jgi:hypothetical protein
MYIVYIFSSHYRAFERETGQTVERCGFYVDIHRPYLGASPDGLVGTDALIEVKCPFAGRLEKIQPGKHFPFLMTDSLTGERTLKLASKYYYQIQGQMFVAKKQTCYFVVYTFKDLFIQRVDIDHECCQNSLLPKLDIFYDKFYMPYLTSLL